MVNYLRVDLEVALTEMERTRGVHARIEFMKKVYTYELQRAEQARGHNEKVKLHRAYDMRANLLYLAGTAIFMDKSATYTYVIYLRYFKDFERIHEYN